MKKEKLNELVTELFDGKLCINDLITSVEYTYINKTTIICTITIFGFTFSEYSTCLRPEHYNEETGKDISFGLACDKAAEFLGFLYKALNYEKPKEEKEKTANE